MYIFGTGKTAESFLLKNKIDVSLFIDSYNKDKNFLKKKVVNLNYSKFNINEKVIICSNDPRSIKSMHSSLINIGFEAKNIFSFKNFSKKLPVFKDQELKRINRIQNKIIKGKDIYRKCVRLRISGDYSEIESHYKNQIKRKEYQEYFEFIDVSKINSFFDLGFYKGFVSQKFIKIKKNFFDTIYALDVQKIFNQKILRNKKIKFFKFAVSNNDRDVFIRRLSVPENIGTYCSVTKKKNYTRAKAISLDRFIMKNKIKSVDFIKIDIEGFERLALRGLKNTIKKFQPCLAIAIYHAPSDFYKIAEIILSYNKNYKIYFNHYTKYLDGSVMTFK
jgi:FkbM family methyltransferase